MKGIYLTEEGKKEIEEKISELENYTYATQNIWIEGQNSGMLKVLEEILSSSTILPTKVVTYNKHYPNGLITIIKEN